MNFNTMVGRNEYTLSRNCSISVSRHSYGSWEKPQRSVDASEMRNWNALMYDTLINKALALRKQTFRAFVEQGEAHLGGSFSIIEMLLAIYEVVLQEDAKFILSKAHASFPLCLLLLSLLYV